MILPNDNRGNVKRPTTRMRDFPLAREFIPIGFRDPFPRENQHLANARARNYDS